VSVSNPNPKKVSPYFSGKYYQAMAEDLDLCGMAKRTHAGYLRAVRQLADYCQGLLVPRHSVGATTESLSRHGINVSTCEN
jgi:hypothetical protein